jgi:tetratricopeptide (TPR) repeat protein
MYGVPVIHDTAVGLLIEYLHIINFFCWNVWLGYKHFVDTEKEGINIFLHRCRAAVRLNPEHFRALKLLGSALYALGDLLGAEAALRDSLAINPDYSDTNSDLGARPLQGSGVAL